MELRIEGHTLPGRRCAPGPDFPGAVDVHVAVQRKDKPGELLEPQPGDAETVGWTLPCSLTPEGELRGPYVQNRLGGRFVYLSWVEMEPAPAPPRMFRRSKLMLGAVPPQVLAEAIRGGALVARLPLTDAKGHPICARLLPPVVEWRAADPA